MSFEIVNNNIHRIIVLSIALCSINLYIFINVPLSQGISSNNITESSEKPCNCVVFRMDGIQDYWLSTIQNSVMDLFLSKNQSLSLGLMINDLGNDFETKYKVKGGFYKGLFELGLNGLGNADYTKLAEEEQKGLLYKANEKFNLLFGLKSDIFIPSEYAFNNNTLKAMEKNGIKILSSITWVENEFDFGKSIFNSSHAKGTQDNKSLNQQKIYHIPETVSFTNYEDGKIIKNPVRDIISNVTNNIHGYGYAVIVLHPQDFATSDNGTLVDTTDKKEIRDLSNLMDSLLANNITISTLSKIAHVPTKTPPLPSSIDCPSLYDTNENNYSDSLSVRNPNPKLVEGLYGEKCVLTQIYNTYGKYLYEKAGELGISPSTAAAVLFVETRGSGFGPDGKMAIRFEACDFYDAWGKDHPKEFSDSFYCDTSIMGYNDKFRNSSSEKFMEYHGDHYKEWKVFEFARNLDEKAAMNSISMGLGQIMGFNHDKIGYETVDQMFTNMSGSLRAQLDGFFMALKYNNNNVSCLDSLKTSDFVGFASCYNASGQDQIYGDRIKKAVTLYSEITNGEKYGNG